MLRHNRTGRNHLLYIKTEADTAFIALLHARYYAGYLYILPLPTLRQEIGQTPLCKSRSPEKPDSQEKQAQ